MIRTAATFLLVAMLAPPVGGSDADGARPTAALAVESGSTVFLAWAPGPAPADRYNVYGARDGALALLASVDDTMVEVPKGYASYSVSALVGGSESEPVPAEGLCVTVHPGPPPRYAIGTSCTAQRPSHHTDPL